MPAISLAISWNNQEQEQFIIMSTRKGTREPFTESMQAKAEL
jgi:hypothetical protein